MLVLYCTLGKEWEQAAACALCFQKKFSFSAGILNFLAITRIALVYYSRKILQGVEISVASSVALKLRCLLNILNDNSFCFCSNPFPMVSLANYRLCKCNQKTN